MAYDIVGAIASALLNGDVRLGSTRSLWIVITVGIGALLSSMMNSVTNTVLPIIAKQLHLSIGQSSWINLVYLLVLILLLLPAGRSDGRR